MPITLKHISISRLRYNSTAPRKLTTIWEYRNDETYLYINIVLLANLALQVITVLYTKHSQQYKNRILIRLFYLLTVTIQSIAGISCKQEIGLRLYESTQDK